MRVVHALKADIRFQLKQGFYMVYLFITLFYMLLISRLPSTVAAIAVPLVVFSDPSLIGFFFIGGIVMLEQTQGILQYLVITPLRVREYLYAKIISLGILSEVAAFAIVWVTYQGSVNWFLLAAGVFLSSVFFTLYGFIVAAGCDTVNRYFVKMAPYMLVLILPCFGLIDFPYAWLLNIFPSLVGLRLVYGAFSGQPAGWSMVFILYMAVANTLLLRYVEKVFDQRIVYRGEK